MVKVAIKPGHATLAYKITVIFPYSASYTISAHSFITFLSPGANTSYLLDAGDIELQALAIDVRL